MAPAKPIFFSDGQRWSVEAEWPDGTIERVDEFKHHSEATDWICSQLETWLQERH